MPRNYISFCQTILFGCVALLLCACGSSDKPPKDGLTILCTTNILKDQIEHVVAEGVVVEALMGPETDPHLFLPNRGDLQKLRAADIILYSGMGLEGKLVDVLNTLSETKTVISVGRFYPQSAAIRAGHGGMADPHIWFDLPNYSQAFSSMLDSLDKQKPGLVDKQRTTDYLMEIKSMHEECAQLLNGIPDQHRVLITTHDAFSYFARNYGMEVKTLQGVSTVSEFGLAEMQEVTELITSTHLPAIFLEPTVPERYLEALKAKCAVAGQNVEIAAPLYADALGKADSPASTYLDMMRWNTTLIASKLSHVNN